MSPACTGTRGRSRPSATPTRRAASRSRYLTNGLHGPVEVQQRYREIAHALIAACEASDRR